ncbi:MAG: cadherin repeat domain-containing protein, partial [Chryseotalea sp.]
LGKLEATTDKGDLTFVLKEESVPGAFEVDAAKGELKVKDKSKFDFEKITKLTAKVAVSNGSVEKTINVTVNVKDKFEDPNKQVVVNNVAYDLTNANLYWTSANNGHSQTHERHLLLITDGVFVGNKYTGNFETDFPGGYKYYIAIWVFPSKGSNYTVQNECETVFPFGEVATTPGKWAVGYQMNIENTLLSTSTTQYTGTPKVLFNYKQDNNGVFDIEGPLYINIPQSTGNNNNKVELRFDGKYKKIF